MDIIQIIGIIFAFFLLLALVVWVKKKSEGKIEISTIDVILALLPLIIYLLLSDKIKTFQYGDLKVEMAFKNAQNKNIEKQINEISLKTLVTFEKGTPYELEDKLKAKPEALIFITGYRNYSPSIVRQYLNRLSSSTVKYVIFENESREFVSMISLYDLANQLLDNNLYSSPELKEFTQFLITNNATAIRSMKGILNQENSVYKTTSKKDALKKMQEANSSFIPVIDQNNKLLGILEDSKLTGSLLLDVSNSITE